MQQMIDLIAKQLRNNTSDVFALLKLGEFIDLNKIKHIGMFTNDNLLDVGNLIGAKDLKNIIQKLSPTNFSLSDPYVGLYTDNEISTIVTFSNWSLLSCLLESENDGCFLRLASDFAKHYDESIHSIHKYRNNERTRTAIDFKNEELNDVHASKELLKILHDNYNY